MSTIIDEGVGRVRRPELVNKIDIEVNVHDAILLISDDGVITALDDKYVTVDLLIERSYYNYNIFCSFRTVRIWLKRHSGKYWPSVSYTIDSNSLK